MDGKEHYELHFDHVVHKTEKAVLVSMDKNGDESIWIPLSLIEDTLDESAGTLEVPHWFADKNGFM